MRYSRHFSSFVLIFFLSGIFSPLLQAAVDSISAREAFEQGLDSKTAGRLDEAERYFKKALEEDPSNADYHFELANIFALEHDAALSVRDLPRAGESLASAARELEQAVMIRPDFMAALFNLGVVYKKQRNYEEARRAFKKAMELAPPDHPPTPFLMQIASIYEEQGFYDDAESIYKDALEKDYGNSEIRNALETLGQRRAWSARQAQREQVSQAQNRWGELGALGRGIQPDGSGSSDGRQPSLAQMIPTLGTWLVQQMMNRNNKNGSQ